MQLNSVVYLDSSLRARAQQWAGRFDVPCADGSDASVNSKTLQKFLIEQCTHEACGLIVVLDQNGLNLHSVDPKGGSLSIRADFHGSATTYRRRQGGGKGQMIAKAVGIGSGIYPHVLDATAGLGRDAFVLASLGCRVTLIERVPVVHALLEDGMAQARRYGASKDSALLEILDRMDLVNADALNYLNERAAEKRPDVIYLDPMFPSRTKSAQVKKEMQVFHQLAGADSDSEGLLEAALAFARYRVVVKRPRLAPALFGPDPSHVIEGKRNRFDVYALRKLPDGLNAEV